MGLGPFGSGYQYTPECDGPLLQLHKKPGVDALHLPEIHCCDQGEAAGQEARHCATDGGSRV